jgi:uncharacterized membrane protein
MAATPQPKRPRYERHSPGLEFDRFVFFSDAVFAIAMTLLVVGIGIPHVASDNLEHALHNKSDEILSFFISFLVIGYYWLAHHRFVAQLVTIDTGFMVLNLAYLAAIAFTPFPTALVGVYNGHTISVVLYAATLGAASFFEVMMFVRAHREKLFRHEMSPEVFRFGVLASSAPVVVFFISIPLAYINTTLALSSWLLIFPIEYVLGTYVKPADADDELV